MMRGATLTQPHEPSGEYAEEQDAASVRRWRMITGVAVGAAALTILGFFLVGQDGRGSVQAPTTVTQTTTETTELPGEQVTRTTTVTRERTATETSRETDIRTRTETVTETSTKTETSTTTVFEPAAPVEPEASPESE